MSLSFSSFFPSDASFVSLIVLASHSGASVKMNRLINFGLYLKRNRWKQGQMGTRNKEYSRQKPEEEEQS